MLTAQTSFAKRRALEWEQRMKVLVAQRLHLNSCNHESSDVNTQPCPGRTIVDTLPLCRPALPLTLRWAVCLLLGLPYATLGSLTLSLEFGGRVVARRCQKSYHRRHRPDRRLGQTAARHLAPCRLWCNSGANSSACRRAKLSICDCIQCVGTISLSQACIPVHAAPIEYVAWKSFRRSSIMLLYRKTMY